MVTIEYKTPTKDIELLLTESILTLVTDSDALHRIDKIIDTYSSEYIHHNRPTKYAELYAAGLQSIKNGVSLGCYLDSLLLFTKITECVLREEPKGLPVVIESNLRPVLSDPKALGLAKRYLIGLETSLRDKIAELIKVDVTEAVEALNKHLSGHYNIK